MAVFLCGSNFRKIYVHIQAACFFVTHFYDQIQKGSYITQGGKGSSEGKKVQPILLHDYAFGI